MVIKATVLGYCMGVRRAVKAALDALTEYPNHEIYTFGPLIHNKSAISMLENKGIKILDTASLHVLKEFSKPTVVVVRAHGTTLALKEHLETAGAIVIDATCPRVLINQKKIFDYSSNGYRIFIVGDKSHGEVSALQGSVFNDSECYVLQDKHEVKNAIKKISNTQKKSIIIGQTTITQHEYNEVANELKHEFEDIIVFDTICPATLERQDSLRTLCSQVDGVLIVGGKDSANTQRLYQIAQDLCIKDNKIVRHIEVADEIPDNFFLLDTVGITAGASTPDEDIIEVEKRLEKNMVKRGGIV